MMTYIKFKLGYFDTIKEYIVIIKFACFEILTGISVMSISESILTIFFILSVCTCASSVMKFFNLSVAIHLNVHLPVCSKLGFRKRHII